MLKYLTPKYFIYTFTFPTIYVNYINFREHTSYTNFINFMYLYILFFNYKPILMDIVDNYANIMYYYHHYYPICKRFIKEKIYKNPYPEFDLINATLYTNLTKKTDVTSFFNNSNTIKTLTMIDSYTFDLLAYKYNLVLKNSTKLTDIRLRLEFIFNEKKYIIFIPYEIKRYVSYPPFTNQIMEKYKHSIILPNHEVVNKRFPLYSYLHINFKDIEEAIITTMNNIINIKEYISQINTPFYDMGLLYDCEIPLKWILVDNNINELDFIKLDIKYSSPYFNEERMELEDNIITITNLNDICKSRILNEYLELKSK